MAKRATLTTPGANALYSKASLDANFTALNENFDNFLHLSGVGESGNSILNDVDFGGFEAINASAPSVGSSLATKSYVDQVLVIGSTTGTIGSLIVDADGDTKVDTEVSADLDRLDLIAAASGGGVAGIQLVGDDSTITSLANPYIKLNQHIVMATDARIGDAIAANTYIELTDTTKADTILFVAGGNDVLDLNSTAALFSQNIEMAVGKKVGDLDNDTYIVFNEGSDDDTVRIYAGGVEQVTITSSTVTLSVDSVSGNLAIGGATNPTGATKALSIPEGTTATTASDLDDNQVILYGQNVAGVESKLNIDFKTGASSKATIQLGEDSVFPNDISIGNDLTVTGDLSPSTMSGTIGGSPTFSGTPTISIGAALAGTFTGNPIFSGLPDFTNSIKVDTIDESTASAGVTIDGVLIKDLTISVDTISESTTDAGVTIDSVLLKDSLINADSGTAGAPSFSFIGDTDTGIFNSSADAVGIAAGGVQYVGISSSGIEALGNSGFRSDTGGLGEFLRTKNLEIGDWDMTAGVGTVTVAHGIGLSKFRGVLNIIIRNDAGSTFHTLQGLSSEGATVASGGVLSIDSTDITLVRAAGGVFDNATFNQTSYNRGYVTLLHAL